MVALRACPQLVRACPVQLVRNSKQEIPDKRTSTDSVAYSLSGVLVRNCSVGTGRTSTESLLVRLSPYGAGCFSDKHPTPGAFAAPKGRAA